MSIPLGAASPASWARATSSSSPAQLPLFSAYALPPSLFPAGPGAAAASAAQQAARFSDPLSMRGSQVFLRMAVVLNLGLWLIRDSSLSSFFLYSLLLNAILFLFVVKGEPFSLALLVESEDSVKAKLATSTHGAGAAAASSAPSGSPASSSGGSPASSTGSSSSSVSPPVAVAKSANAAFSFPAQKAAASAASASSPRGVAAHASHDDEERKGDRHPAATVAAAQHHPAAAVETHHADPVAAPHTQPAAAHHTSVPASASSSASSSSASSALQLHQPTEDTPVVLAGATSRHSSEDLESSWTRAAGSSYDVRIGPNYKKYGKKAPSKPCMFECVGVDVFGAPNGKLDHVAQHLQLPWIAKKASVDENEDPWVSTAAPLQKPPDDASPPDVDDPVRKASDHYEVDPRVLAIDEECGCPTLFIVNFQIPTYAPAYFGNVDNGAGFSILLYYQMSQATRAELRAGGKLSAAVQLFKDFVASAHAYEYHSRFKAIPRIVNPGEANVGMATRAAMKAYNSKPFLTGPHCHAFIRGPGYMEADIDVHRFCLSARKGAHGTLGCLNSLIVDIGFVIEAGRENNDDELPEQILGCGRIAHLDPMHAKPLSYYIELGKKERAARLAKQ